ncbi:MAG: AlpA family phage regulatory protein [Erythrobacter sp.]|jgi:prophage regulatory protein|nr:AlpA family phage regulatory protein [Erythrobacter sp.]
MANRFISVKEVLERICLSRTELYDRMKAGTFPQSVALGPQKVVFVEAEVEAWMQAKIEGGDEGVDWRRWRAQRAVASRRDRGSGA